MNNQLKKNEKLQTYCEMKVKHNTINMKVL